MISFNLNGNAVFTNIDESKSLLFFLRNEKHIISVKDGCSGEGTCGACMVEYNGKPRLACTLKLGKLKDARIVTIEGIPENIKIIIANSFVDKGAVQCGFCTPALIIRSYILLNNNKNPSVEDIKRAISVNLCRCTGYVKIIEAILLAAERIRGNKIDSPKTSGKVGDRLVKYQAFSAAIGQKIYTDDLFLEHMLFSALKFSAYPKAKILNIDTSHAEVLDGVIKVITKIDIPGEQYIGLINNDWPLMIGEGEVTRYIGDVLASVVATSDAIARHAIDLIKVDYEVLEPVTDPQRAMQLDAPKVHPGKDNLIENCVVNRGNAENILNKSDFIASGNFQTQRVEHAYMEKECAVAEPKDRGIKLYSQSQGIYEDRRQIALILDLNPNDIEVELLSNGGGFGGKEDLSVQGHVALQSFLVKQKIKLTLTRQESIKMHPKRHPVTMNMSIACDKNGKLTAAILDAIGDTGAYESVGTKVMERVAGHATGGYYFPNINLQAKTVYTNNIPCGAMRGFGANQVTFALEVLIDELCEKGGFDRWQFRYNNALIDGLTTSTGQKVYGVGIRECLLELKNEFYKNKYSGLACGIKNSGVGNGMVDKSGVKISIVSDNKVLIEHGWTEMGQGVHNMAIQTLCTETNVNPAIVEVKVNTKAQIETGMTTSSRATALLGLAIIDACKALKNDLNQKALNELVGNSYFGEYICDWTNKPEDNVENPIIHYSYGYAAQLCILNNEGKIEKFIAAHDGGKIMNPMLFEGQVQGAVHMGLGFALSENLPMKNGFLQSDKLNDCGVLRAKDTPAIEVKMVEKPDPVGPYGAKGVGEIGLVPTAGAVANAYYQFNKKRQYKLPLSI